MASVSNIILGIDPGSHRLGVGCVRVVHQRIQLIHCQTLTAPRQAPLFERLKVIGSAFHELLEKLKPEEVAVEGVFHAHNARSAIALGTARGMAIGACLQYGLGVHEYAATQVKSVVTGYGRADKKQVQKMVEILVGSPIDPGPGLGTEAAFDAADAVAIAICHASHRGRRVPA